MVVSGRIGLQEFILLSEACRHEDPTVPRYKQKRQDCLEFNAMMITWKDGISERTGLGRVVTDAHSIEYTVWKDILLG